MKIIHIVHGKANPNGHNGISRVVYHLNKFEKIKGCNSQIWAVVDGVKEHFSHRRDEFVTVECFPRVWLPFGHHEIIEKLIAEKDSIDLVHFHMIWFYDKNIIAAALKRAGIRFIITTHGTYSKLQAYTGKRLVAKWLFELKYLVGANEIHVITREEGTGLQEYGYNGPVFVAYNGVDLDEIPSVRSKEFLESKPYNNKIKFLWVGVLREDKNLRSLIRAVATLPQELRDKFVCILVGPDYRGNAEKYLRFADELNCSDCFDWIGPLYGQDKYDAIESADVFVMPSNSEVFSLVVLDAMACGKPCLVTSGCGLNYFSESNSFVRCEPYAQDISEGIRELLEREHEWVEMGNRARSLVETELNWHAISDVMISEYSRIVGAEK